MASTTSIKGQSPGGILVDAIDRLRDGREVFFRYIRSAADFINTSFEPLTLDDKLEVAVKRFQETGLSELPVVDVEGDARRGEVVTRTPVGILRLRSVNTILSQFAGSLSQKDTDERALIQPIVQYISRDVPRATPDLSLFDAIAMMLRHDTEALSFVGPNNEYIGVVTSLDLLRCFMLLDTLRRARVIEQKQDMRIFDILGDAESKGQPTDMVIGTFLARVQDVMKTPAVTINNGDTVMDAMKLMEDRGQKTLFVVDQSGALRGLVSDADIQLALPPTRLTPQDLDGSNEKLFRYESGTRDARQVLADRVSITMQANPTVVSPDESVVRAAELLSRPGVSMLPVVEGGRPRGYVGRRDLLRVITSLGQLAKKRGFLDD